jgi:hypothetical protein
MAGTMRRSGSRGGALAGLLLAGLLSAGCATTADAAPGGPPGPPDDMVATNPAVQQWFKRHEPERIAVNNALAQANLQVAQAPGATTGCAALQKAADAMLAALPTPKKALDSQVVAGVAQLKTGAQQCLAGDLAGARASLAAGAAARAAAEDELEEILEAPDGSVD